MADDKTEPATPKRRKKAREDGQVARSTELVGCAVLLAMVRAFRSAGPLASGRLTSFVVHTISGASGRMQSEELCRLAGQALGEAVIAVMPLLCIGMCVGVAANVAQVGLHVSGTPLTPRLDKLDPFKGIQRLVTVKSAVELLKSTLKAVIVGWSAYSFLSVHSEECFRLSMSDPEVLGSRACELAYGLAMRMISTLTVLAALDYAWQRYSHEKQIRMTKQEVKDEFKQSEGNPEVKGRQRQRQRLISRRRMMADVRKAAVVVVNPTHFAIALQYELGQKGAPLVVAKGQDLIALKIREVAEEAGVPIVENPPLARAIYGVVDIGEEIPQELYKAVAEVLAMLLKLDGTRPVGAANG